MDCGEYIAVVRVLDEAVTGVATFGIHGTSASTIRVQVKGLM